MDFEALKKIPGFPHNFAGFPEYEEKLSLPCAYTGKPCSRAGCKKWAEVLIGVPNPLHPATIEQVRLHQCQDDLIAGTLITLSTNLQGFLQQMSTMAQQQMMRQKLSHGPGMRDILGGQG